MGVIKSIWKGITDFFSVPPSNPYGWVSVSRVPKWAYKSLMNAWSGQEGSQVITTKGRHYKYKMVFTYYDHNNQHFEFYKKRRRKPRNNPLPT